MSKSSFLSNTKYDKSNIALACMLGIMLSFLLSRVGLSITVFLFGVNALWNVPPRLWLRHKWWLLGVGWVTFYAISWFWSDDKANWGTRLEVKLPVLLLPLAFSFTPRFSSRQWYLFTLISGIMLCGAAFYSISFFITAPEFYIKEYSISHVLPTLPKMDHIRCSIAMVLFIIWSVYMIPLLAKSNQKWVIGIIALILTIYIHILAAKSGLISFYIFLIAYGFYYIFSSKKVLHGLIILLSIPAIYLLALNFIPTFYKRIEYIGFFLGYRLHDKTGIYGDLNRVMSYDVALKLIKQHPLSGVGTGDVLHEMKKGYKMWYPQVAESGQLIPHNQFLTVALGCGIPAMVLFLVWVFAPLSLIKKNRESFFFFVCWLILFIQLMIEPMLEVQFGVFVYFFFLLIYRHILSLTDSSKLIK